MEQWNLFEGSSPLRIKSPIRLIELFAGIGAQAKALERIGVPFEHYRVCEIDSNAVNAYNAVHGTNFTPTDITKISAEDLCIKDTENYTYILTYSFPCQDLSMAGARAGMQKGSGTRSGLLWEVERILTESKELPQILIMENVPQVKTSEGFSDWCLFLESKGYINKCETLNAKDYGVPQNRERAFMVSWQGDYYYDFPSAIRLKRDFADLLEKDVDEKYYITEHEFDVHEAHYARHKELGHGFGWQPLQRERERETAVHVNAHDKSGQTQ